MKKISLKISGENLDFIYTPSIECDIITKESFYQKLESVSAREIENGSSLYGIQRDDIRFFINDKEVKTYASQGQQRTAVLSLKMAQMENIFSIRGEYPVLLLDDIMSELDISRQDYILNHIKDWQVFITCCDANTVLRLKQGKTFHISNGGLI